MFREQVVVAFITLSLVLGVGLGYALVADLNAPKTETAQIVPGSSSTDSGESPSAGASAAPDVNPTNGSSTSTTSTGGNSGGGRTVALANSQSQSGVSNDKIVVGGIFDMTGPVDSSVERDTVRAYFNKVNAAGGVNGRKLQLTYCDSQYDNVQTHNCSNEMVSAKVLAVVGWTAPKGENDEVKFLAQQQSIPIIGGLGTPEEYRYPLSFPVSVPFTRFGPGLAEELQMNGFKHPAIVYIGDVPWIQPVLKSITDALHARGIQETHSESASATDPDYTGHESNLRGHGDGPGGCAGGQPQPGNPTSGCPDSLIAALDPFSYQRLFQAMDRDGWHPTVFGGGLDKGNQQNAYGDQLKKAQSLVPFFSPYDHQSNATVQDYLNSVQRYYPNQVPALDVYTQISWTSAMVFVEAVKRAGANLTRATLVQALNTIKNFDTGWSPSISYSDGPSHDPAHCYVFMKHDPQTASDGGNWKTYTDWKCY